MTSGQARFEPGLNVSGWRTLSTFLGEYSNALQGAKKDDVRVIAEAQTKLLSGYYGEALSQAKRAFFWAAVTGVIGVGFFFAATLLLISGFGGGVASIAAVAGAVVEVVSGISLALYSKATTQLGAFLQVLVQLQRFLLAHSMCDSLQEPRKSETLAKVIVAHVGMPAPVASSS